MKNTGKYLTKEISYKDNWAVNFLYKSLPGRLILNALVKTTTSRFFGILMDSPASKVFIKGFIKNHNIDIKEYKNTKYKSFNDFFTREIRKELRPFSDNEHDMISPCDGKLTAYPIEPNGTFFIKNSMYTIKDLLQDETLADEFIGGVCLIFRLTTNDYHRYVYIDDGEILSSKKIKGLLHTVRPIAYEKYKVYAQNAREYTVLQTKNFGKIIQMEVGALFVGRIKNHNIGRSFKRCEEKGMFEFGGSTIVMLIKKDILTLDNSIFTNTLDNKETVVRMGNKIGERIN